MSAGAHMVREREDGTLLHLAGCWCWRSKRRAGYRPSVLARVLGWVDRGRR